MSESSPASRNIDDALLTALRELVAAHLAHKCATEAFLAAQDAGEVVEGRLTRELDQAHFRVAEEGSNVAILAFQRGIEPSEER